MNNQLIENLIKSNTGDCPNFIYKNPLLDPNVARALSSSFVKILSVSDQNSKINNNLRHSILENIRRMCQMEPASHATVDESMIQSLTELYQQHTLEASSSQSDSIERKMDAFLIRNFSQMHINPMYPPTLNPEIIQALINLNDKGVYLEMLSNDIIHWQVGSGMCILMAIWDHNVAQWSPNLTKEDRNWTDLFRSSLNDDIAIKMRPDIEKKLLNICLEILTTDINIESMFASNTQLEDLIKKCVSSKTFFQICTGILNFVFIVTNFDVRMQEFISMFIKKIKSNCSDNLAILYPIELNNLVMLMDVDLDVFPTYLREQYVNASLTYLSNLHEESESNFILLLSHFPQWFDIYFSQPPSDSNNADVNMPPT